MIYFNFYNIDNNIVILINFNQLSLGIYSANLKPVNKLPGGFLPNYPNNKRLTEGNRINLP